MKKIMFFDKSVLTKRQKEHLDFVENFIKEKGYRPSYREISSYFGISVSASFEILKKANKKLTPSNPQ